MTENQEDHQVLKAICQILSINSFPATEQLQTWAIGYKLASDSQSVYLGLSTICIVSLCVSLSLFVSVTLSHKTHIK